MKEWLLLWLLHSSPSSPRFCSPAATLSGTDNLTITLRGLEVTKDGLRLEWERIGEGKRTKTKKDNGQSHHACIHTQDWERHVFFFDAVVV